MKTCLQEQLASLEENLLVSERLAEESVQRADALEEKNQFLGRELDVRETAVAAARAEVGDRFSRLHSLRWS